MEKVRSDISHMRTGKERDFKLINRQSRYFVETANEQLYNRHLIQWVEDTDGCYKINTLIREFLKVKLAGLKLANDLKRAFAETMVAIASSIPYAPREAGKFSVPH